jgi:hypothetical protein
MKNDLKELIRQLVAETIEEIQEEEKTKKKADGKDVTGDGQADFADVMASRFKASGMSKDQAVKKAKKYEK